MRRLAFILCIIMLSLSPASLADDSALPLCADDEFLKFFNMIVEHQIEFDAGISNASMLHRVSRAQMESREAYMSQLPMCADAIAIQRLLIQLGGDALARAALELADLSADENPYLQRLPGDQARIEGLLSTMIGVDRSGATPSDQRGLRACEADDWALLENAAAELQDLSNSTREESHPVATLAAIDRLLRWREKNIPGLPACAESIDLIQALSAVATDAAATQAFTYGGVSPERNPFPPLLEASMATVISWQEQLATKRSSQAARIFSGNQLPACAPDELSEAFDSLRTESAALLEQAASVDSSANLIDFGAAQIAFRETRLAQLPMCAEAFAWRWWMVEALADAALRSAIAVGAPYSIATGHRSTMSDNAERASSARADLKDALEGVSLARAARRSNAAAPACSDADHVFLFAFLAPAFWKLTDAALAISQPQEVSPFIDQSFAFRRLLWENLPRCADTLEAGILMQAVAADFVAMLALELAQTPVTDIPYLPSIASDINRFFQWADQFTSTCGSLNGGTTTYYVVAENIANIRSCASTSCAITTTAQRGQRLDVVDDKSNWYEIVLPSCDTAFIAGFLASQTPPPR
ncbi:MAG: SH3 domain-containing protein [Chloroflexi bacterium]|nr:SH3 domain-containing protein [Chloroflexota bacterium]